MWYGFTVTKREIIASVVIVALMLVIGMLIGGAIDDAVMDSHQKYNTALQIDNNRELFEYGMRTNVGNAFIYGDLKSVDTVTYPDINGQYMSVSKKTEEYTMHTRTVTRTDADGNTYTDTEVYWSWDTIAYDSKHASSVTFLGVEFPYDSIKHSHDKYIDTVYRWTDIRDVYYGTDVSHVGTLYANLSENGLSDTEFHCNQDIKETLDSLNTNWQIVLFWIFWVLLTGGAVFGFCYLDNYWLEDNSDSGSRRRRMRW